VQDAVAELAAARVGAEGLASEVVDVELAPGQVDAGQAEAQGGGARDPHGGGPDRALAGGARSAQVHAAGADGRGRGPAELAGDSDLVPLLEAVVEVVDLVALGLGELDDERLLQRLVDPAGGQPLLELLHFQGAGTRIARGADDFGFHTGP
jgi:hypothetical protein